MQGNERRQSRGRIESEASIIGRALNNISRNCKNAPLFTVEYHVTQGTEALNRDRLATLD